MHRMPLVLASSSPYRRMLLERLVPEFRCHSPEIDESPIQGESAGSLVRRLAREKARAVASAYPDTLIVGSDQVAVRTDGTVLGKPATLENAREQLRASSGTTVTLETGLCLLNTTTGRHQCASEQARVHFRHLDTATIDGYLQREQPLDCAGSFRCEGLGISLFRALESRDPATIIGLPLILLAEMLRTEGHALYQDY